MIELYIFGQGRVNVEYNKAARLYNTGKNIYNKGLTRIDFPVKAASNQKVIKYVQLKKETE